MTRRRRSENEAAQVARLLAPLSRVETDTPEADDVYWRARARVLLDQASHRRKAALRPLRLWHLSIGVAAIVLAAFASAWPLLTSASAGAGLIVAPILVALITAGAHALTEAGTVS